MEKSFYVTTPIYYPNDIPHIGTAYTTIAADCITRFEKLNSPSVFFLTGSDEHGQKIAQYAKSSNQSPKEYVDKMVEAFKKVWKSLGIEYNDFIRTTEERHIKVVEEIFKRLFEKGEIYKGDYEGWYCVQCESFWLSSQVIEGKCPNPECRRPVQWVKEEGYFFKLSKYEEKLLRYIEENPEFIEPASRRNEIISFVKQGLQDICISRKGLEWGISIPSDPQYSIYVWIDALINYISAIGYIFDEEMFKNIWPAEVHLVGKDIIRFHAVIWPALLMALNLPLPKKIFAHGWLVTGGEKVSKSKGGTKNLIELIETYGADSIRYFLMREATFGLDMEFSEDGIIRRINSDLANDLGNLFNRTIAMVIKYQEGKINPPMEFKPLDNHIKDLAIEVRDEYFKFFKNLQFREALNSLWKLIDRLNRYIEENAPWQLFKENKRERIATVLYYVLEGLRFVTIMVYPVMPESAEKMWKQLGFEDSVREQKWENLVLGLFPTEQILRCAEPLFPKIKTEVSF